MSHLVAICPKLPMRNKNTTRQFYVGLLGFTEVGDADFPDYLMVCKDNIELHFFAFPDLNSAENYGQVYIRTNDIEIYYQAIQAQQIAIHPNGTLQRKPWGQQEFSLLDPDNNLLTFGQSLER